MSADLDFLVALMPFAGHLGLVLDEASPDRVIARLDWAPHLCTSGGIMHGGVRAVAVPVHRGRTTVTAQTSLFDSAQRLVAQTTQIQAVRQPPASA
jgi:acyl-coenzyme A thioesterase PaaI-like protein